MPTTQLVEVDVRYDVGSREDPPGKAGLAHLVEHRCSSCAPTGRPRRRCSSSCRSAVDVLQRVHRLGQDPLHDAQRAPTGRLDAQDRGDAPVLRLQDDPRDASSSASARWCATRSAALGRRRGPDPAAAPVDVYPKGHAYEHDSAATTRSSRPSRCRTRATSCNKYYMPRHATVVRGGRRRLRADLRRRSRSGSASSKKDARRRAPQVDADQARHPRADHTVDIERPWCTSRGRCPRRTPPRRECGPHRSSVVLRHRRRQAQKYDFADSVPPSVPRRTEARPDVRRSRSSSRAWTSSTRRSTSCKKAAAKAGTRLRPTSLARSSTTAQGRQGRLHREPRAARPRGTPTDRRLRPVRQDVDFSSNDDVYMIHELDKIRSLRRRPDRARRSRSTSTPTSEDLVFKPSKEGVNGDIRSNVTFQTQTDTEPERSARGRSARGAQPLKVAASSTRCRRRASASSSTTA